MLSNNYKTLEDLRVTNQKCVHCSLCKFPPLTRVEHAKFSAICPSYEELKSHASSGGGLLVMSMSLVDGRATVTDTVRRFAFSCTACGGCDVACKYNSDIEVIEAIYFLRAKAFDAMGPYPEHAATLASVRKNGHPLADINTEMGDPVAELLGRAAPQGKTAEYLLWVGPHYALQPELRATLRAALELLRRGGVDFTWLGPSEPYVGRAVLEIGDRKLFGACAERAAKAIAESRTQKVLCLSAEDYATFRAQAPKFAKFDKRVLHIVELYSELIHRRRLRPRHRIERIAAWHDASYLGRLAEPFVPWQGEKTKVGGQMIVYRPNRVTNWGRHGCYQPPRDVLAAIPGLKLTEFYRQREYAFDSGETGQTASVFPHIARHTARRRIDEGLNLGVQMIVTECPQSSHLLAADCRERATGIAVTSLTDLLFESVAGGVQ